MSAQPNLLIIGTLPPTRSAAAELCLHIAKALEDHANITCVIDDLAPMPPEGLGISFIRLRDLRQKHAFYRKWQRLHVLGSGGVSLFALNLLQTAPGIVVIAELSLFPLAESVCRLNGTWPDAYWQWLNKTTGENATTLYSAIAHHRRESMAQCDETPAFDLLLENAGAIIAPSPAAELALRASGMAPTVSLPLWPVKNDSAASANSSHKVLYVAETGNAAQIVRTELQVFEACADVEHIGIHPGAGHLAASIAESDIVVLLGCERHACSPALSLALSAGKCVITANQKWAKHLPEGSHLQIPHSEAYQALVVNIAALIDQSRLRLHVAKTGKEYEDGEAKKAMQTFCDWLIKQPIREIPQIEHEKPRETAPVSKASVVNEPILDSGIKRAILIGAIPPDAVLKQILPNLNLERCPRFATPAIAKRLGELTSEPAAILLARLGFQAPIIKAIDHNTPCHRAPEKFVDVQKGLKINEAVSFGCGIEKVGSGNHLLKASKVAPRLEIHVPYDASTSTPETYGFEKEVGLFWRHDTLRDRVLCITMVGIANSSFRLYAGADNTSYLVATDKITETITSGSPGVIESDTIGLLSFEIVAIDPITNEQLESTSLRNQLKHSGLTLEWSVT